MQRTNAFHEYIGANLDQKISIWQKCHLESTMFRFRHSEIPELCCDFPMDLGEKAILESPSVTYRLQSTLSIPGLLCEYWDKKTAYARTYSFCL